MTAIEHEENHGAHKRRGGRGADSDADSGTYGKRHAAAAAAVECQRGRRVGRQDRRCGRPRRGGRYHGRRRSQNSIRSHRDHRAQRRCGAVNVDSGPTSALVSAVSPARHAAIRSRCGDSGGHGVVAVTFGRVLDAEDRAA